MWLVAPMWRPCSSWKPTCGVRLRPDALGSQHERVADDAADGMARAARDRRGDEAVRRALEQRHLLAGRGAQRLGVAVAPVLVDQRALAQVADAGAAAAQEGENVRVSGSRPSAWLATWTACSSGAPMCGEPSETTWRTCFHPGRVVAWPPGGRRCARRARPSSARRARPPRPRPARRRPRPRAGRPASGRSRRCGGRCCSGRRRGVQPSSRGEPRAVGSRPWRRPSRQPTSFPSARGRRRRAAAWRPGTPGPARRARGATGRPSTRTEIGSCSGLPLALEAVADQPVEDREPEAAGSVADSGRCGRGRRPTSASAPRGHGGGAAERADDAVGHGVVDEADRLARGDVAEGAGGDIALHGADAPGEPVELVEAQADEGRASSSVSRDQLCHGSIYLPFG